MATNKDNKEKDLFKSRGVNETSEREDSRFLILLKDYAVHGTYALIFILVGSFIFKISYKIALYFGCFLIGSILIIAVLSLLTKYLIKKKDDMNKN